MKNHCINLLRLEPSSIFKSEFTTFDDAFENTKDVIVYLFDMLQTWDEDLCNEFS